MDGKEVIEMTEDDTGTVYRCRDAFYSIAYEEEDNGRTCEI
jgi:hypothetical protein